MGVGCKVYISEPKLCGALCVGRLGSSYLHVDIYRVEKNIKKIHIISICNILSKTMCLSCGTNVIISPLGKCNLRLNIGNAHLVL